MGRMRKGIYSNTEYKTMDRREINIVYTEFGSLDELSAEDRELALEAVEATRNSYAPYSRFNVGAAVRLDDGTLVTGANQENIAYPSGLCAERTAMFYAAAEYPDIPMKTIAIAASSGGKLCPVPATPCGACRQVMAEYQSRGGHPISIILVGAEKIWKFSCVDDILPLIFDSLEK